VLEHSNGGSYKHFGGNCYPIFSIEVKRAVVEVDYVRKVEPLGRQNKKIVQSQPRNWKRRESPVRASRKQGRRKALSWGHLLRRG
jgi:hypothetical protein